MKSILRKMKKAAQVPVIAKSVLRKTIAQMESSLIQFLLKNLNLKETENNYAELGFASLMDEDSREIFIILIQ